MRKFNDVDFKASDNRDWLKKPYTYSNKVTGVDISGLGVGSIYCCADGTLANDIPKDGECFQIAEVHDVKTSTLPYEPMSSSEAWHNHCKTVCGVLVD